MSGFEYWPSPGLIFLRKEFSVNIGEYMEKVFFELTSVKPLNVSLPSFNILLTIDIFRSCQLTLWHEKWCIKYFVMSGVLGVLW